MPPRSVALKSLSEPSIRPKAVRAPPIITASRMPETIPMNRNDDRRETAMLTRIDHVGIACRDLGEAVARYQSAFGLILVSQEIYEEQGVKAAMLQVADAPAGTSYVQLLEPLGPDTPVGRFLRSEQHTSELQSPCNL